MTSYTTPSSTFQSNGEDAVELRKHFDQLRTARKIYEKTWDDITEYYDPSQGTFVYKQQKFDPQRKSFKRLESTPINASRQLMARVNAEMTGNSTRWFDFREPDPKIDKKELVRRCLQALSDRTYNILNNGVFRTAHIEFLMNWILYGTACMEAVIDDGKPLFKAIPTREIYIAEDKNNKIDTVYRSFSMTYRQCCQYFGDDVLPCQVHEHGLQDPFYDVELLHCVKPNSEYNPDKKVNTKFKFISMYLCMETNDIIKVGYFKKQPYVVARFWKRSGESYGGSAAMDALPDTRLLNLMQEASLRILQRKSEPPLVMAHDSVVLPVKITPNGMNYGGMTADGKRLIGELFENRDNDQVILEAMEQKRQSIRSAFFVDPLINRDKSIRTAAEVNKRTDEELVGITPFLARLEIEYLMPILDFVLDWVLANNRTIPIPPELHNHIPAIEFSAPLAQTQRGQELQNMVQLLQMVQNLAQVDPSVIQHIDMNNVLAELVDLLSVPMDIVKPAQVVAQLQAAQAKAQAQQQQMQQANEAAKTIPGALSNMAKAGLVGRQDVGLPPISGDGISSPGMGA